MANSITFNGVDLSAYGLVVTKYVRGFERMVETAQLKNKAVKGSTVRPARRFEVEVAVTAVNASTLQSYLDSIFSAFNLYDDAVLKFDKYSGRYWMASFENAVPAREPSNVWIGTFYFVAADPDAYDNDETTSNHTIDDDPETFDEVVGGTAPTDPVYTLTADDVATEVTIANATTGEELIVTIDLVATDELEIDTVNMTVKLNGTESMSGVSGNFPRFLPGTNAITVEGFSGTMSITYRKRYI